MACSGSPLSLWRAAQSVFTGLSAVFVLVVLRVALGRRGWAIAAFVAVVALAHSVSSGDFWMTLASNLVGNAFFALTARRTSGLRRDAFYVAGLFIVFPVTVQLSRSYAGAGVSARRLAALAAFDFADRRDARGPPRADRPSWFNPPTHRAANGALVAPLLGT